MRRRSLDLTSTLRFNAGLPMQGPSLIAEARAVGIESWFVFLQDFYECSGRGFNSRFGADMLKLDLSTVVRRTRFSWPRTLKASRI